MIILLSALIPLIASIVWLKKTDSFDNELPIGGVVLSSIWTLSLIGMLIQRNEQRAGLREIEAFKYTLQQSRNSSDPIERAAFLQSIAKWNEKIANAKYWNEGLWDWWNVDEFANQEFIK